MLACPFVKFHEYSCIVLVDVSRCTPRLRAATIHQTSPVKLAVSSSSSSSSTFQKDLSRLLDPDISDYDLHRTLSEKVQQVILDTTGVAQLT